MTIEVEREDFNGSFQTLFRIKDGNNCQEVWIPTILADDFELKIKTDNLELVKSKTGKLKIK